MARIAATLAAAGEMGPCQPHATLAAAGVDRGHASSVGGEDPGGGAALVRDTARDAGEGLLRRTVAWFGCYLVWCGPYPSPPTDGPDRNRLGGPGGLEDAEGEGGWAAERILVRHLRGRTAPKALRFGPDRPDTPPGRDPARAVRCAEQ